jgi:hypothetical protein
MAEQDPEWAASIVRLRQQIARIKAEGRAQCPARSGAPVEAEMERLQQKFGDVRPLVQKVRCRIGPHHPSDDPPGFQAWLSSGTELSYREWQTEQEQQLEQAFANIEQWLTEEIAEEFGK